MALALSTTTVNRAILADYKLPVHVTCDSSYPTGGYALTPQMFGLSVALDEVLPITLASTYVADINWQSGVPYLRVSQDTGSGLIEVPNTTDIHTLQVTLLLFGR